MINIINISEFRNNMSNYINRLLYLNEVFFLKKGKKIVAKVIPVKKDDYKDKIERYRYLLNDKEAKKVNNYAKKLRKSARFLPD